MKPKTKIIAVLALALALAPTFADESLPPFPHEQLEKILDEIVMHEEHIIARGESIEPVETENFAYLYWNGNTCFVSVNEDSPYMYFRIKNSMFSFFSFAPPLPNSEIGIPNFIALVYGRPTRKNMEYFSQRMSDLLFSDGDNTYIDAREMYAGTNDWTISLKTSVKIAGDSYEVLFTDIDDDQAEN